MLTPLPGPPRRIGPYQLLARVGAGGMGEVHLARRAGPGPGPVELVALKSVREDLDLDDAFRARFRREIAAARAVAGPYTAAVLDADPDAERPWLATEYVAGPSLAGTVARCGPLPVPTVRALGTGLARALSAVHAARLLHRDLKPGNVLLTLEGPRLIDFGIARAFEATQLTAAGAMIGTPGYLAPEQLRGTHALTPASDVFALGAVLAHAAGGHGPFEDVEPAAVIYRTATGDADLEHVPPLLRDVVARCLATDPAHRPSPDEVVRALAAQDGPVWPADVRALFAEHRSAADGFAHAAGQQAFAAAPTAPGAPPGAAPRSGRPRRGLLWAGVGVATAAVAVAAVLLPGSGGGADDPSGAGQAPPSRGASASPGAARPGGVVMAYGGADHSGEFGADALDAGALPRGWAPWAVPYPKDLVRRGAGCALASGTVVCRDARGGAAAVAAASGKQLWAVSGSGATPAAGARQPAPVTDGRSVFVTGPSGLRALRLGTGKEAWSTHGSGGTVLAVAYAAGTVYTVERTGGSGRALAVRARAADDGARTWSTSVEGEAGRTPGFAVSGGRIYVASSGSVAALSAQDGSVRARRTTPGCTGLLARSGAVLCWSERSAGVRELDGGTLAVRRVHGDLTPSVPPVAGSAGVLVVAGADVMEAYDLASGKRRWRLETADSAAPRVLALAGSKVLWVDEIYLKTMDLSGDAATRRTRSLPSDGSGLGGALGEPVLLSGTAIFAADGRRMVSTTQP